MVEKIYLSKFSSPLPVLPMGANEVSFFPQEVQMPVR
jgi:hypothetical protein